MRPSYHLALSAVLGAGVYAATGEPMAVPVTVAVGTLIDVDHVPDYYWTYVLRRRPVGIVALHAWEWMLAWIALDQFLWFPSWLYMAVVFGYGMHLVTDVVFNKAGAAYYSFIYRAATGFRKGPGFNVDNAMAAMEQRVPYMAFMVRLLRKDKPNA